MLQWGICMMIEKKLNCSNANLWLAQGKGTCLLNVGCIKEK
uniref:Uncharacterized protein n=1 Tax=Rhizophora mucronata TaxID=61149 RepID=A0A2P2NX97_RHIMU